MNHPCPLKSLSERPMQQSVAVSTERDPFAVSIHIALAFRFQLWRGEQSTRETELRREVRELTRRLEILEEKRRVELEEQGKRLQVGLLTLNDGNNCIGDSIPWRPPPTIREHNTSRSRTSRTMTWRSV